MAPIPTWLLQRRSPMRFCSAVLAAIAVQLAWRCLRRAYA
jgi:hypothetical protein